MVSKSPSELHPIDQAISFWVSRKQLYHEFFYERKIISTFVSLGKLCVKDKIFLEEHSESFIDGLVVFSQGFSRKEIGKMDYGENLMKPMMDKIILFLTSDKFQKSILSLHITGQEKVPVMIPEIVISVHEMLLFLRREGSSVFSGKEVNKLKQGFILDKIEGWGLNGEFGEKIKMLESILYPSVFNPNGFLFFDFLMKSQDYEARGAIEDITYFFHQMKKDGFIHSGRDFFKTWFNKQYLDFPDIEKIHDQRSRVPLAREDRYFQAMDFIKSKKD
jgi:hypothetical protein